jgi:hypothetical protein
VADNLKPFSKSKQAEIVKIARTHATARRVIEGRGHVVFVTPNLTDRGQKRGAEQALVGVYDYDKDRSLVVLVDPVRKRVVSVEEPRAQLQLDADEKREAERLAAADDRVRRFLRRRRMNPLTRLYFPPGESDGHRYAIVFLRPSNVERRFAVVDLSAGRVAEVLDRRKLVP